MMKRALAGLLLAGIGTFAQTSAILDVIAKTVQLSGVAISADGRMAAWVQDENGGSARVFVGAADGSSAPRHVGLKQDSEPAFSPDGRTLAFFSGEAQKQLYLVGTAGGSAKTRTKLKGYAARPKWSHDGTRIAFLYIEGAGGGGPLLAAPAQTGVIDQEIRNQRVAILDVASGQVRQVSPEGLHVYDFEWSPDDTRFVTTAAPGPGDNNWWVAKVQVVDVASGSAEAVYQPKGMQVSTPRWSPDGQSIAFVEGIMSDEGFHGGDLFTMAAKAGSAPVNRTPKRRTSVSSFTWASANRIGLTEFVGGGSSVSELNLGNGEVRTLYNGAESLWAFGNFPSLAFSPDGKNVAAVRRTYESAPEVWVGVPGAWKQLTKVNAGLKPVWGRSESVEWENEGQRVQGWLMHPRNEQAGRKYPMVVLIHGGPAGMAKSAWPSFYAFAEILSNSGFFVLEPNPRGSYGQGEAFTRANVKDFGHGDLRDVMAGVDAVTGRFPVDAARLGVTGWSYGGYMTMWTVTQTNRFKAAVAGAGISNWQSYYGQNLIDQWMIPYFGASVYDDPFTYRKSSPMEFIQNVKTPTLVIVGERDAECPAPQSYEFWHALRAKGVKTELVVYKDEGHLFMDPKNRRDLHERLVAWFEKSL